MFKVGDKVVKNPDTWIPNAFDEWGRGKGVGIIIPSPEGFEDLLDVRWPDGRCFEEANQLLPYTIKV